MGPVCGIVKGKMSYGTDTDKPQDLLADGAQAYTQTRPKINRPAAGWASRHRLAVTKKRLLVVLENTFFRVLWGKEHSSET